MSERRETPRRSKHSQKRRPRKPNRNVEPDWSEGERIAKYLARAGIASRREVEAMIERGEVRVNGRKLTTPAFKVLGGEDIHVNGKRVSSPEAVRLWRYHKPAGLLTTTSDPAGRRTIFDELSKSLPRTMTVGRLDLNTEGLLLLTNDGGLARELELPKTALMRRYRTRAHGQLTDESIELLKAGVTVSDGQTYAPISCSIDRRTGTNSWITVELVEGKNREVRKALEHVGLQVNRLIRTVYGPFELGELKPGAVEEVPSHELLKHLQDVVPNKYLPDSSPSKHAGKPPRKHPARNQSRSGRS